MAYTRITNTRNGSAAIRYAFEEPSHREGMDRVLMASGSNLDPRFAMIQMRDVWKAHGKNDGETVQMYRVIQSFGLDELDPNNPNDVQRANEIGQALASELYPDKQALIVTQADGEGGKLHNHVLVNSVSFTDGKSLRGYRKEHDAVAEKTDEILVRYGMKPLDTENTRKRRTSQEKRLAEAGKYVWKDDLRGRIDDLLSDPSVNSQDVFIERMKADFDVDVKYRGKSITYSFEDANGTQRKSRDKKLGTDYGQETVSERFETNALLFEAEERRKKAEQNSLGFDFDFESELQAMVGQPKAKSRRSVKPKETELMKQVRLEREAKEQAERMDKVHAEALLENAHIDAIREEQAREKRRAEQREIERQQQAERERREQEKRRALEQQRQLEKQREQALKRIHKATTPYTKVTPEFIDKFIESSRELKGKTHTTITGKRVPYSDTDIYHHTRFKLAEEKRKAQQGHNVAVEQNQTEMDALER